MENSHIGWTDHTFNPWWGCLKVSPGCAHCYAEHLAVDRYKKPIWGPASTTHRQIMSANYWKQPIKWNKQAREAGKPARVFCASMADVFEDHPDVEAPREMLWSLIKATPNLIWMLLTKRPENFKRFLPEDYWGESHPNVWLGTSVENQEMADQRIPYLLNIPARVRFLSVEPQLGPITLTDIRVQWSHGETSINALRRMTHLFPIRYENVNKIDWVIVGGESGSGCRPMDLQWARATRDECKEEGTAFFFKQVGGTKKIDGVAGGDLLDGVQHHQWPEPTPPNVLDTPSRPATFA